MDPQFLHKYAQLLVHYCGGIRPGDRVLIRSTILAEPLMLACQKAILLAGGTCEFDVSLNHAARQFYEFSSPHQLTQEPILYAHAVATFDVIVSIHAPHNIYECTDVDKTKLAAHQSSRTAIKSQMMQRGSTGALRWVICNYPTQSLADAARMSLADYANFIANACFLNHKNPQHEWEGLSAQQAQWIQPLNKANHIHFKSPSVDISFRIKNRRWINSDGKRNMPSGEIFTSPHETSGNGTITFDVPSLLLGQEVNHLTLVIKDGLITEWQATKGQAILNQLFAIDGARRIGEIAIGTNHQIHRHSFNTLYDEKIGGTIHMAIGASYPETGGTNASSIHHDFICQFKDNARIYLDDRLFYENGAFF